MQEARAARAFNLLGAVLALNDSFETQQMAPCSPDCVLDAWSLCYAPRC